MKSSNSLFASSFLYSCLWVVTGLGEMEGLQDWQRPQILQSIWLRTASVLVLEFRKRAKTQAIFSIQKPKEIFGSWRSHVCFWISLCPPSASLLQSHWGDGVNQGFFFVSHLLVMELIICMYLDMVDSCPCQPPYVNEKAPKFNFPSNW